jgi:hypothetical protein
MSESYAVVWSEPDGPRFVGSLTIDGAGMHLRGASAEGHLSRRSLAPHEIAHVRVQRPAGLRADASPSVILEQPDGAVLSLVAVNGAGVLFEIANLAATMVGRSSTTSTQIAMSVPIRPEQVDRVRELLRGGPPFDPEAIPELESHHVYLGRDQVIFTFEGRDVQHALDRLMHSTSVWIAAAAWRRCIAGQPATLETGYTWRRQPRSVLPPPPRRDG